MPVTKADIPEWAKDLPDKAKSLWVKVWNDTYASNSKLEEGERIKKAAGAAKAAVHSAGYAEKVKARLYAQALPLSGLVFELKDGKTTPEPTWAEVCKVGTWVHPEYGIVTFTKEMFAKMVQNFKDNVLGFLPNLNWQHSDQQKGLPPDQDDRSAGKFKDVRLKGDVLEVLIDWALQGYQDVKNRAYTYLSALIVNNDVDRETGGKVGPVLHGGALTNTPFITDLAPISLSLSLADHWGRVFQGSMSMDRMCAALYDALDRTFGFLSGGGPGLCDQPKYALIEWFDDKVVIRKDDKLFMAPYTYNEKADTCSLGDFVEATYAPKKGGAKVAVPQVPAVKASLTGRDLVSTNLKPKGGGKMKEQLLKAVQEAGSDAEAFSAVQAIVQAEIALRDKPTEKELALKAELDANKKALRLSQVNTMIAALRSPSGGKVMPPAVVDMLDALLKAEGAGEIKLAEGKTAHDFTEGLAMIFSTLKDTGMVNLTAAELAAGSPEGGPGRPDDGTCLVLKDIVPTAEERELVLRKTLGGPENESRIALTAEGASVDEESIRKEVACLRAIRANPSLNHQAAWNLVKSVNF